jgi:hypothetical protein
MPKIPTTIRCACGEHYAASYLSGMGLVVALTRAGTPATDLIVTSEIGGRSVSLQVKTGGPSSFSERKKSPGNSQWTWRTGRKAMDLASDSHWFAFVYVGNWPQCEHAPQVFFVPSQTVAKRLRDTQPSQQDWFWMMESEADQFRGMKGYEKLAEALAR